MNDFTMGGFISGTIASGVAYIVMFSIWEGLLPLEGFDSLLFGAVGYIVAIVGYFSYMGSKKSGDGTASWTSSEIGTGFFASLVAQWSFIPVVLFFD
tara:strand:+ start:52 stop:342 length:291 start_codon:yes stop_codon:yes gene_type:complete